MAKWRSDGDAVEAESRDFSTWVEALRLESMTIVDAWEIVGRGGMRLSALMHLFDYDHEEEDHDVEKGHSEVGLDVVWPIRDVLDERISPELSQWIDVAADRFGPPVTSTVSAAVAAHDGTWAARLQGLFLPVSAVVIDDEETYHASWLAGPDGNSTVYYTHQDEVGFHDLSSLSAMVTRLVCDEVEAYGLTLPSTLESRLHRAYELIYEFLDESVDVDQPDHLSVAQLYPRTGWITSHLLPPVWAEHGLADAPGLDVWESEREFVVDWPHLQSYWLLHHLVFGNWEELPYLVEHAERRHPAVAELASLAEHVLAGRQITAQWWDETLVRGLRAAARNDGHTHVFNDLAARRLNDSLAGRDAAAVGVAAATRRLAALDDPAAARLGELWNVMEIAATGSIDALERYALDTAIPDEGERMKYFVRQHAGHTSILIMFLMSLTEVMSTLSPAGLAVSRDLFASAVRQGSEFAESHSSVVPGSLVGLGWTSSDFGKFLHSVTELIGQSRLGRYRRAELAVIAAQRHDQPAAREFLLDQAQRYATQLHDGEWKVDTMSYALWRLLEIEPDVGGRILTDALTGASFSGANYQASIALSQHAGELRVASAAPGLLAAINQGLGHHDKDERVTMRNAYISCVGDK